MDEIIHYITEKFIKNLSAKVEDFYDSPGELAEFIINIRNETDELARRAIQTAVQELDVIIKGLPARKKKWHVEHDRGRHGEHL